MRFYEDKKGDAGGRKRMRARLSVCVSVYLLKVR